jgi:hypothetical protein
MSILCNTDMVCAHCSVIAYLSTSINTERYEHISIWPDRLYLCLVDTKQGWIEHPHDKYITMSIPQLPWPLLLPCTTTSTCKGISIHFLTPPTPSSPYPHWYVFPMTPVYIWPPCNHSNLLTTVDISGQYFNIQQLGWCKRKCWPNLNIIPACRTRRFCSRLPTTSRDCDHNGHSQY